MGRRVRQGGVVFQGAASVGDVAGRDLYKTTTARGLTEQQLGLALRPVAEAVAQVPGQLRAAAEEFVAELHQELAKPQGGSPSVVRKIVDGLLALVPSAAAAVATAFASPVLAAAAGAATQPVVDWLKARR